MRDSMNLTKTTLAAVLPDDLGEITQKLELRIDSALRHEEAAVESARRHAIQAWHAGTLLNAAKEKLPHGQWVPWLEKNVQRIGVRTAQLWMKLCRDYSLEEAEQMKSVKDALRKLGPPVKTNPGSSLDAGDQEVQDSASSGAFVANRDPVAEPSIPHPPAPLAPLAPTTDIVSERGDLLASENTALQRKLEDAERRIKLLKDDARPDAAARLQEMANVQQENATLRGQVQHWQQRFGEEQRRARFFQRLLKKHGIDVATSAAA